MTLTDQQPVDAPMADPEVQGGPSRGGDPAAQAQGATVEEGEALPTYLDDVLQHTVAKAVEIAFAAASGTQQQVQNLRATTCM